MKQLLEITGVLAIIIVGWICGTLLPIKPLLREGNGQESRDTVYLRDTVYEDQPVPIEVTPKGYDLVPAGTMDRIAAQINALEDSLDSKPRVIVKDSLVYVEVPMEQKHYGDSTYDAWVSGYRPTLDSLRLYQTTKVVTVTKTLPPRRFSFGFQGGFGVQYDMAHKQFGAGPYLGAGFEWRF